MRYIHGKLKAKRGTVVKVSITAPTRILLMNSREYRKYKDNMSFTYYGGHKDSVFELEIPKTDEWHVVVEKGANGSINVSANVEVTHPVKQKPKRLAGSIKEADQQLDEKEAVEEEVPEEDSSDE